MRLTKKSTLCQVDNTRCEQLLDILLRVCLLKMYTALIGLGCQKAMLHVLYITPHVCDM